jgi:putative flavoprotein involved in K+ transport
MMVEHLDTVIIGSGQAGLAMSFHLTQSGREHILLEKSHIAERWQSERWDSLHFQFPNWSVQLPGMKFEADDPDGFSHHASIIGYIKDYARKIDAPVRVNSEVIALRSDDSDACFQIETSNTVIKARNVVIATGPFQVPNIPAFSKNLSPSITQTDASHYRSPDRLPSGGVLVVGSGASGCQIADELYRAGRTVYLSVSSHRRVPRRYHGKDLFWWFEKMGRFDVTIDTFPGRKFPPSTIVTGINGGYDVDINQYMKDGVQVLGHIEGASGFDLALASDANKILRDADAAYSSFIAAADQLVAQSDLRSFLTMEDKPSLPETAEAIDSPLALNLREANINTVIWATGHRFDFKWAQLPVFDPSGAPIQKRGVTSCPGLYFLGLHWMHTFKSGLLSFVGEDAAYLADYMAARA